jgi:hypothetical protein
MQGIQNFAKEWTEEREHGRKFASELIEKARTGVKQQTNKNQKKNKRIKISG